MVSQMIVIDRSAIQISKMRKFLVLDVEKGEFVVRVQGAPDDRK